MAQVTQTPAGVLVPEYFTAESKAALAAKMDARLGELEQEGHTLVRRTRIGRNSTCLCGSGLKFKKCCINKLR